MKADAGATGAGASAYWIRMDSSDEAFVDRTISAVEDRLVPYETIRRDDPDLPYGDVEVVQMSLGTGDDTVRVDYTTNAEDHTTKRAGDFYTLTLLNTGAGNDTVTGGSGNAGDVRLDENRLALNMELARRLKAPYAVLTHIPNQPLYGDLKEDKLIADGFVAAGHRWSPAPRDDRAIDRGAWIERGVEFRASRAPLLGRIDRDLHGSGPHIDNFETQDDRALVPGVGFSIEPGVYLTGRFGVRSEINVFLNETGPEVTPSEPQRELWLV